MKVTELKKSLAPMGVQQLREKLENLRQELFSLRLNASTSHVKDYAQFKQYRKNIARVLTLIGQKNKNTDSE